MPWRVIGAAIHETFDFFKHPTFMGFVLFMLVIIQIPDIWVIYQFSKAIEAIFQHCHDTCYTRK